MILAAQDSRHAGNHGAKMNDRHSISPYPIRMPQEMRDHLEESAKKGGRSLHAEIMQRLDSTIALDDFMAEHRAGTYAEALDMLQSVWADNDRLADNGEQTFGAAYAIIDKLLDEKLDDLYRSQFRMPYELYEQLKAAADASKNSVDAELVARLQESFAPKSRALATSWEAAEITKRISSRDMRFIETLELGKLGNVVRFQPPGSTHVAIDQLLTCLATLESITRVTLAVRDGYANHSALSVVIHTEDMTLLADSTPLTVERPPRESEVRNLIWALDTRRLLDEATRFRAQRIPQTSSLPGVQAVKAIEDGELVPLGYKTLETFLNLFHERPMEYSRQELDRFFAD